MEKELVDGDPTQNTSQVWSSGVSIVTGNANDGSGNVTGLAAADNMLILADRCQDGTDGWGPSRDHLEQALHFKDHVSACQYY